MTEYQLQLKNNIDKCSGQNEIDLLLMKLDKYELLKLSDEQLVKYKGFCPYCLREGQVSYIDCDNVCVGGCGRVWN